MNTNLFSKIRKSILKKLAFIKSSFLHLTKFSLNLAFDGILIVKSALLLLVLLLFLLIKSITLLKVIYNIKVSVIIILLNILIKY